MKNIISIIILSFFWCSCSKKISLNTFEVKKTDLFDIGLENELNTNYEINVSQFDKVTIVTVKHNNPCYYCCETIVGKVSFENGKIKLIAEYNKPNNKGENEMVQLGTCTLLYTYEIKGIGNKFTDSDFVFEFIHFRTKGK